jgi:hypothetical protein
LFAVLTWRDETPAPGEIHVSADQVRAALRARLPGQDGQLSAQQLDSLVESLVRDEVYYREALALGLDVDDDQVRTRLVEKIRYLTEDLADPDPPDEATLQAFFDAEPQRFAIAEAVSFDQVFFSPSQRGPSVFDDARAAREALEDGADPATLGDSTPLGNAFSQAPAERLRILFGDAMTESIFAAATGVWSGPFESDFGLHLVRVTARRPARQRSFAEAREAVLEAWAADQRARRNAAAYAQMRERYEVVVDWPAELEVAN